MCGCCKEPSFVEPCLALLGAAALCVVMSMSALVVGGTAAPIPRQDEDEWCSDCLCVACMQLRLCVVGQTFMSETEWLCPGQAGPCLWCTVMT